MRAKIFKYLLEHADDVTAEALDKSLDLRALVVSKALGIAFEDVTPLQRAEAKTLMFAFTYGGGRGEGSRVSP